MSRWRLFCSSIIFERMGQWEKADQRNEWKIKKWRWGGVSGKGGAWIGELSPGYLRIVVRLQPKTAISQTYWRRNVYLYPVTHVSVFVEIRLVQHHRRESLTAARTAHVTQLSLPVGLVLWYKVGICSSLLPGTCFYSRRTHAHKLPTLINWVNYLISDVILTSRSGPFISIFLCSQVWECWRLDATGDSAIWKRLALFALNRVMAFPCGKWLLCFSCPRLICAAFPFWGFLG